MRLDVPVTVRQAAAMAGMSTRAMKEMLLRFGCVEEGILVRRKTSTFQCKQQWVVTSINDLRKVWPSFARKLADDDEVQELRKDVERLHERLRIHEDGLRNFRAKTNEWYRRIEKLEAK